MARVSSPARQHRPQLPRLTPRPRPGASTPRAGHEPAMDVAHAAAGADAGRRRRPAGSARHQGRSAGVRHHAGRRAHLAADRGGTGRRCRRLGCQRLRHLDDPRRRTGQFVGITGLERRPDGRGVALRFALWPEAQGHGLAREAASAALRFGHDQAGLDRIVAVARESNFASRMVLGGIGMTECDGFVQQGHHMVMYESVVSPPAPPADASR